MTDGEAEVAIAAGEAKADSEDAVETAEVAEETSEVAVQVAFATREELDTHRQMLADIAAKLEAMEERNAAVAETTPPPPTPRADKPKPSGDEKVTDSDKPKREYGSSLVFGR